MAKRIAVVVSQGQSNNPAKRNLEEDIIAALMMEPGVDVTVVPNLYDLKPDGTGILALQGIKGNLVLLSWMFPRAAQWILDRNDISGHVGETMLEVGDEEDFEEEQLEDDKQRVADQREIPNRKIFCLDLRSHNKAEPYVEEVKRIASELSTQVVSLMDWVGGSPKQEQMDRFLQPTNDTAAGNGHAAKPETPTNGNGATNANAETPAEVTRVEDEGGRRWYPVIDFSRCTNCMECIDFCLFGVYGVDGAETILVEQPDNCRKGCPACSRVCPENAIIFPQHKTPAIAGSSDAAASLKIDLSKLFGAPDEGKSAAEIAALERDEQLIDAGRAPVGMTVGIKPKTDEPRDELDDLLDELDDLDL